MITSKNSVGGRKVGKFPNTKGMPSTVSGSPRQWVLTNSKVTFTFLEDHLTGLKLESWKHIDSATTYYNESRNLWTLNIIRDYTSDSLPVTGSPKTVVNHYDLYPRKKYFNSSVSQTPVTIDNKKVFSFIWNDVPFDQKNTNNLCRVTLTATLEDDKEHLDIRVKVEATSFSYSPTLLQDFNSACVTSIQFPTISIKKDSDETVNNKFTISTPVAYGYTYHNPFKYLRTPRYLEESFQYTHLGTRSYPAGSPGFPDASILRFNYGSPGGFQIPAIVLGNKDTFDGTLIYALDQEGTNPKGFQFYFDDQNLHFKTYHMSDHQVDPYGLGGYTNPLLNYSIENNPTWSFRIRPFKSTSKWVDWYGYDIYRKEVVPEQEEYGWLGKSFYDRYQASEISKPAAEMPMVMNVYGYTTGTLDNLSNSIEFYKELYRKSVNPNIEGDILFPIYYTPATLGASPVRNTGASDPLAAYYGWYPWAGQGTGVGKVGPEIFKSPDYTGLNSLHTGAVTEIASNGDLIYSYNLFPFVISTGSVWTNQYSGIDLCVKSLGRENDTYTNNEYRTWAYSGASPGLFGNDFVSCIGVDLVTNKYLDFSSGVGALGLGTYHDTVGIYGRGCFAKGHKHYDPSLNQYVTKTHPRGGFSKYFNDLQISIFDQYNKKHQQGFARNFGSVVNSGDLIFKQCAEFATDTQLKYIPIALTYEPLGPIYNLFFNDVNNPRPDVVQNTFAGVDLDDDPVTMSLLVALGQKFWSSYIKPPNWIQRCPAFQIALSDRSIWDEWVAVHHTNAFNAFFKRGAITGYGEYGRVLKEPITTEYQAMNWSSFTAQTWPYTNRLSTWHVDNQVEFIRPDLPGIINNEYAAFTGIWSGYLENFTKKQLRIQAYNPDYIYHGSLQHPLDSFSSEIISEPTESRLLRRCANPNTGDPFTVSSTVDKIQHIVRKHRKEDNFLIVAGNWFSGTSTFSATFDPATYGITNGYQVYSLELNASNHGTKSLVAVRTAGEAFSFTSTLDEYGYVAYEIETNTSTLDPNVFGDVKTAYAPVRYSYDVLALTTTDATFAYSYGSSAYDQVFNPQEGYKSASTQEILNNLPQWMKMRQSYDSNGWKLTNSWGMGLDNVLDNIKTKLFDINLTTADTKYFSSLSYVDIDSKELLEGRQSRNLLFNSSFTIKDASRLGSPAGWTDFSINKDIFLDYRNSIMSPVSITSSTGKIKIGQEVILDNVLLKNTTASIYLNCNAPSVNVKLHVAVERMDGTSISFTAQTSNRSSEWVRLVLPIEVSSNIYKINYSVISNCDGPVSICAPQLEIGSVTSWTSSVLDFIPFLNSRNLFNVVYSLPDNPSGKKVPIFNIENEKDFLQMGIPTRVEKTTIPNKEILFIQDKEVGRKVEVLGDITNINFDIVDTKIKERSSGPSIWDFFGSYDIRDLRYFDITQYGTAVDSLVTITPLACAIRKDYLFVVCKEEYNNKVKRVLKIVRPRTPPNNQTYLESFIDFDLDIQFNDVLDLNQITDDEVGAIGFSDIDPSYMVIVTTNNIKYYYKLYFDYYFFNNLKNRLYTIESYKNSKISIL